MTKSSRREFFLKFTHDLSDLVDLSAVKNVLAKIPAPVVSAQAADWVVVGRLAEFAPGVVREVKVSEVTLTLLSQADGLWAERADGQRISLRTEMGGVVLANVGTDWPINRMLSHLTGEPIDAESQDDIQNRGEDR